MFRRACASPAQSHQSPRCSRTWSMDVDGGSGAKTQTSSPTGWLHMRVWRMNLRRTKSTIMSWRGSNMSHVMRTPVLAICEQQRRRSACASAQSDQRLCCSLPRQYNTSSFYIRNFKHLPSFCRLSLPWSQTPKTGFLVTRLIYQRAVGWCKPVSAVAFHIFGNKNKIGWQLRWNFGKIVLLSTWSSSALLA